MTLDEDLLADVRRARVRLDDLEDAAWHARDELHTAVRRLHSAGGSLREIAQALGMSHQRVHQIVGEDAIVEVGTAGGTPRSPAAPEAPGPTGGDRPAMARRARVRCGFCNAPQGEVAKVMIGAQTSICNACVRLAVAVASGAEAEATRRAAVLRSAGHEPHACQFCGKTPATVDNQMVKGGRGRICGECLQLCSEILTEEGAAP